MHARSVVLVAAGAYGKAAIDAVHLDIGDVDGLAAEASDAAASGFTATACIHPSQVDVIRAAYRPTDAEVAWARGVLAAAVGQHGAFRWDGTAGRRAGPEARRGGAAPGGLIPQPARRRWCQEERRCRDGGYESPSQPWLITNWAFASLHGVVAAQRTRRRRR